MLKQSLNGAWQLRQIGTDGFVAAEVPGCVHLDLMSAKTIDDPFLGDNEYRVAWVHEADWEYSRTFDADPELIEMEKVFLECEGLDTLCTLELNGQTIGSADNMYITHRFDVTGKLLPSGNTLKVTIDSPAKFGAARLSSDVVCPGDSVPGSVFVRKAPCQFGWDWGPKIPTSGIWRPISLVGYDIARIDDLRIAQNHVSGSVKLNIETALINFRSEACGLTILVTDPEGRTDEYPAKIEGSTGTASIQIDSPKLWWPNGYGEQPLYTVQAVLSCDNEVLDASERRIGLRTITLDQTPDQWGRRFTFVVNGVPIFCKGADWVPADQFPSRITDEHYRHLIRSTALANMNMLRIWGGGFYEDERFYDLCDEYGILIWQDFMFACAHYPIDAPFLDNVRREVEAVVKRLRNRACLALWCGNNEQEQGVLGWWNLEGRKKRQQDYPIIYHQLIPETIEKTGSDIPYWPSSPSNGIEFYTQKDPCDQNFGDAHYWDVWHGRKPFADYRNQFHRFMSEFGFESMPDIETVRSFAREEDLNMTSHIMECHQKNSAGNGLILYYMAQTFRFPKDFEMMCYASQLLQAEAMRFGVEHWRRQRNDFRSMGTLYWQLNDTWPVSSWASIDYFGKWKATQYFAKRFNEPVHLSVCESGKTAKIHITNDLLTAVEAEVKWSLEKLDGSVIRSGASKLTAAAEADTLALDLDFTDDLTGDLIRQAVIVAEMTIDGKPARTVVTPLVPSKHLELPEAEVKVTTGSDELGSYIDVSTDKTVRYLAITIPGRDVILSDNYFDLPAGRSMRVRIDGEIEEADLARVRTYSLRDSY